MKLHLVSLEVRLDNETWRWIMEDLWRLNSESSF